MRREDSHVHVLEDGEVVNSTGTNKTTQHKRKNLTTVTTDSNLSVDTFSCVVSSDRV